MSMLDCPPPEKNAGVIETMSTASGKYQKKPVVLSQQRFEKLMNNSTQADKLRAQKEVEEEEKYRKYLKDGSDALVARFKGNIQRTQEDKMAEFKQQMEKKMIKIKESYDLAKENERKERLEKITKAQNIIEQLKPGPRQLHCAALQSEVLRARNVQRNINEEFEKAVKKQECLDKMKCTTQNMGFIFEEQSRQQERAQNVNAYKKEILQTANDCNKQRAEFKKQQIKEAQAEREAMDREIQQQIEKEKAIMEKKRAALRKNALEAMKMVEQRRLRERMTDEIEERLCAVYTEGKRQLDHAKALQAKQAIVDRQNAVEANVKILANLQQKGKGDDDERVRRDLSRMQLKFTAEEQEKIRKDKAAKQARIEAYMRDVEAQKEAKRRAEEEKRFEMAQRFKNTEMNAIFEHAQKQERLRKLQENRAMLKTQDEENKRRLSDEREAEIKPPSTEKETREDQYFFEYAKNLMEDAHKKERPLYPFIKVVNQYKRDRNVDCERKTPKHLVSQVDIGVRKPGDSEADAEGAAARKTPSPKGGEKAQKESILENCLKISQIIAAEAKEKKKRYDHHQETQIECMKQKNFRKLDEMEECAELLKDAPNRKRYTVYELKRMNQFANAEGVCKN